MKSRSFQTVFLLFVVMTALIFLNACASLPFKSPEEAVRQRVAGVMNARINNDWGEVYSYLAPEYRETMTKQNFLQIKRDMAFLKFSVESVEISPSGEEATVKVKFDMQVMAFTFKDEIETQQWIKDGFNWYLKVKVSKHPFPGAN